ncbi:MAG: hypothetical protein VX850_05245 [Gemmatimonadota bacterium]|nr:hypothetical protein [Gemmatimonadota bacterium]MEC9317910.1 hypothetical protein [Gemmatimonadota bacterium]
MPDSNDSSSENQDIPPRGPSSRPVPTTDTSDSPVSKHPHHSKNRRRNRHKDRNKRIRGATDKQAREKKGNIDFSHLEPDLEEVILEVDGKEWTVRVIGRSQTQTAALLMLGFWISTEEDAGVPDRETLIAGRELSELNPDQLQSAYEQSRPPRTDQSREFFSDIGNRGRN